MLCLISSASNCAEGGGVTRMSTSYVRKWHQWGISHGKREHALGTRLISAQSVAAALPTRQTFAAPKLFTIMLMVRRAILRISCSVGGLGGMSSTYVEENGCSDLTHTSWRLFVCPSWLETSTVVTYWTLFCLDDIIQIPQHND